MHSHAKVFTTPHDHIIGAKFFFALLFNKEKLRNFVKRTCTHCSKNGYIIDVCYKKHGFFWK